MGRKSGLKPCLNTAGPRPYVISMPCACKASKAGLQLARIMTVGSWQKQRGLESVVLQHGVEYSHRVTHIYIALPAVVPCPNIAWHWDRPLPPTGRHGPQIRRLPAKTRPVDGYFRNKVRKAASNPSRSHCYHPRRSRHSRSSKERHWQDSCHIIPICQHFGSKVDKIQCIILVPT